MSKKISQITEVVTLVNNSSAYTGTGRSDSEVTNLRQKGLKGGVAMIVVNSISDATDEEYTITISGRSPSGTGAYTTINSIVIGHTQGSGAGVYLLDIDQVYQGMQSSIAVTGTSKSILYSIFLVCPADAGVVQYAPTAVN